MTLRSRRYIRSPELLSCRGSHPTHSWSFAWEVFAGEWFWHAEASGELHSPRCNLNCGLLTSDNLELESLLGSRFIESVAPSEFLKVPRLGRDTRHWCSSKADEVSSLSMLTWDRKHWQIMTCSANWSKCFFSGILCNTLCSRYG